MPSKKVSIIMPARNEECTIGFVLDEIHHSIANINDYSFEVIVGLDHCTDKTEEIAREKGAQVYRNLNRTGKGNAIRAAAERSSGEIIVMLDADGSHNPADLRTMIEAVDKGLSLVIASRAFGGSDESETIRLLGNVFFTFLVCLFFKLQLTDAFNGYKAFKKEVFSCHSYSSRGFEIEVELIYSAVKYKALVGEISSHERRRMGGRMKSRTFPDGLRFLAGTIKWGIKYRIGRLLGIK